MTRDHLIRLSQHAVETARLLQVTSFRFEGDVHGSELQLERFEVRCLAAGLVNTWVGRAERCANRVCGKLERAAEHSSHAAAAVPQGDHHRAAHVRHAYTGGSLMVWALQAA